MKSNDYAQIAYKDLKKAYDEAYGFKPKNVRGQYNLANAFWVDVLLRITKSIFKLEIPEEYNKLWSSDYILDKLVIHGLFAVCDTPLGLLPLKCSLSGINVFEEPTTAIFAVPMLNSFEKTINVDCVVYTPNGIRRRNGLYSYVLFYAQKLANIEAAVDVNLFNSRSTEVYAARDKKEAESLKAMTDQANRGEPQVFIRSDLLGSVGNDTLVVTRKVKENFITNDLLMAQRIIIEQFLTGLGINNANTDKRERLNEAEVNSNNEELLVNTAYWNYNLEDSNKKVKEMFGIDFKITMPYRTYVFEESVKEANPETVEK